MIILLGEFHDLRDLGFCDLVCEDTTYTHSATKMSAKKAHIIVHQKCFKVSRDHPAVMM